MSALALYAGVATNPSFWRHTRDASTQTESAATDVEVQTQPCPFRRSATRWCADVHIRRSFGISCTPRKKPYRVVYLC